MNHPSNLAEEAGESVNPEDQGLSSKSVKSESHAPAEQNEALLKISQDMAHVLKRLTTSKASIDMIRRQITASGHTCYLFSH